jgi:hypothetical protein
MAAEQEEEDKSLVDTNRMGEVVPGLWIGSLGSVKEIRKLSDRRWTVISALHSDKLTDFLSQQFAVLRESHPGLVASHVEWNIEDKSQSAFLSDRLLEILKEIDAAVCVKDEKRACLVHCAFGISRSAAIVAAWLISRHVVDSLQQAMAQIRAVRPEAMPNLGFVASLRAIEQCGGIVEEAQQRLANKGA